MEKGNNEKMSLYQISWAQREFHQHNGDQFIIGFNVFAVYLKNKEEERIQNVCSKVQSGLNEQ